MFCLPENFRPGVLNLGLKTLSQLIADRAIGQWRRWLECVVQQQGRHIEHLM